MFSSIASFLFGVPANANSETDQNPLNEQQDPQTQRKVQQENDEAKESQQAERHVRIDDECTFLITQLTPSVTGGVPSTNGKKKRSKRNKQARRRCSPPPSDSEPLDEEWCIVDNRGAVGPIADWKLEAEEFDSRTPSPIAPLPPREALQHKKLLKPKKSKSRKPLQLQLPQEPQRQQFANANTNSYTADRDTPQAEQAECLGGDNAAASCSAGAEAPHNVSGDSTNSDGSALSGNGFMEESWYVTPPPCFTSTGPGSMEVTPYENLLIEHPSKSVYLSIRAEQEVAEILEDLDLGVDESQQQREQQCQQLYAPLQPESSQERSQSPQQLDVLMQLVQEQPVSQPSRSEPSVEQWSEPETDVGLVPSLEQWSGRPDMEQSAELLELTVDTRAEPETGLPAIYTEPATIALMTRPMYITNTQVVVEHAERPLLNHYSLIELKQALLVLYGQKIHAKKEHQNLGRGALKRANQARDFQSRGHTQRRSDMQHCRVKSYVNNNRKCGYVKC